MLEVRHALLSVSWSEPVRFILGGVKRDGNPELARADCRWSLLAPGEVGIDDRRVRAHPGQDSNSSRRCARIHWATRSATCRACSRDSDGIGSSDERHQSEVRQDWRARGDMRSGGWPARSWYSRSRTRYCCSGRSALTVAHGPGSHGPGRTGIRSFIRSPDHRRRGPEAASLPHRLFSGVGWRRNTKATPGSADGYSCSAIRSRRNPGPSGDTSGPSSSCAARCPAWTAAATVPGARASPRT